MRPQSSKEKPDLKRGQITVFAALMFLVIMGMVFCVLEGIRSYLTGGLFEDAVYGAGNRVRAYYDTALFDRYHLFFLDPRESDLIRDDVRDYVDHYCSEDSFFGWICGSVSLSDRISPLDLKGEPVRSEIREWMKYKKESRERESADKSLRKLVRTVSKDMKKAAGMKKRFGSLSSGKSSRLSGQDEEEEAEESEEEILWKEIRETFDMLSGSDLLTVCGASQKGISTLSFRPSLLPSAGKGRGLGKGKGNDRIPKPDVMKGNTFSGLLIREPCWNARSSLLSRDADLKDYIHENFACFTTWEGREQKESALRYEREYLVCGEASDQENLKSAVSRIFILRFMTNYINAEKDGKINARAEKIARKAVGKEGLPDSVKDAKTVLIAVLSYGETIVDMRKLLKGGKVKGDKREGSFYLTFDSYAERIRSGNTGKAAGDTSYEDYLDLILTSEKLKDLYLYRMMDLMQLNVKLDEPGFLMSRSLYSFSCTTTAASARWYPSIPGFGIRFGMKQKLSCRKTITY